VTEREWEKDNGNGADGGGMEGKGPEKG